MDNNYSCNRMKTRAWYVRMGKKTLLFYVMLLCF